jgi:hypothetical protein
LLGGCAHKAPPLEIVIYYEAPASVREPWYADVTMPQSGFKARIFKNGKFSADNIADTLAVETGLENDRRPVLLVRLDDFGTRTLYQDTLNPRGMRMILSINGQAVGIHPPVTAPIKDGSIPFYMELQHETSKELREKIVQLSNDLNASILIAHKASK